MLLFSVTSNVFFGEMNGQSAQENKDNPKQKMTVNRKIILKRPRIVATDVHDENSRCVCPHVQENNKWREEKK